MEGALGRELGAMAAADLRDVAFSLVTRWRGDLEGSVAVDYEDSLIGEIDIGFIARD